jgi:hypothetical protein
MKLKIKNNFNLNINDDKIIFISETLMEIHSLTKLLQSYSKSNINIEGYVSIFLSDRHQFLNDLIEYLKNTSSQEKFKNKENYLNELQFKNYKGIIEILQIKLGCLVKEYKKYKENQDKQNRLELNFWNRKKSFYSNNKTFSKQTETKQDNMEINQTDFLNNENESNHIQHSKEPVIENWIQQYLPQDTAELDQTKNMMENIGKLLNTFSQKIFEHNEITQISKNLYIINI